MKFYLGIDIGSISTDFALIDEKEEIVWSLYLRTEGDPIGKVKEGLEKIQKEFPKIQLSGVGTTGSARYLIGKIFRADLIKNEISAHAKGTLNLYPDVRTIIEIGGQDSKIIILENGVVVDFGMNLLCAAGTGSFLDAQAARLKIPIEEFGKLALKSKNPVHIASRCTVFAESDMIHKQQMGHPIEDIIYGLCLGLARNYLASVGKGKEIKEPIVFQGGVSENVGMRKAFEEILGKKIIVPKYNKVMGAYGVALLTKEKMEKEKKKTKFGMELLEKEIKCESFRCKGCPNECEVVVAKIEGKPVAYFNDRCGKWSNQDLGNF